MTKKVKAVASPADPWPQRIVCVLLFLSPIAFLLHLSDAFDLPKLALVYLAVGLLAWRLTGAAGLADVFLWKKTALDRPLVGFLFIAAVSTVFSLDRSQSLLGQYRIYVFGLFPMLSMTGLFWLTAQLPTPLPWTAAAAATLLGSSIAGVYGWMQFHGDEIFERMPRVVGGRVWSSLGNPVYLGAVGMIGVTLGYAMVVYQFTTPASRVARRWPWPALMAAMVASGTGLVLSLSRGAWLGTAAGIVFVTAVSLWNHRQDQRQWKRIVILVAFMMLAVAALAMAWSGVRGRAAVLFSAREESNVARLAGWKAALRIARRHPMLGSGPDTFFIAFRPERSITYLRTAGAEVTQADAHNDELQMLSTMGLLGLLFYGWILVAGIVLIGRLVRRADAEPWLRGVPLGLAAGLIGLWIQNQFNFSSVATTAWAAIALGFLAAAHDRPDMFQRETSRTTRTLVLGMRVMGIALGAFALWSVAADAISEASLVDSASARPVDALRHARLAAQMMPWVAAYPAQRANMARTAALQNADPALRQNLFSEAWTAVCQNTDRHPADPDAWNNRGVAAMWLTQLSGQNRLEEARAAFLHAAMLDPVFVDAWANLAKWNHITGDIDGEKKLWEKVLTLDPHHEMARKVLGRA